MKDIAHRGCIKGFVYRFMYVRVREKMACKVIRQLDSIFDGFPNMYFITDFKTRLEGNKAGDVEKQTESCKWRTALFHAQRLALKNI